jgi:hypothetical protein
MLLDVTLAHRSLLFGGAVGFLTVAEQRPYEAGNPRHNDACGLASWPETIRRFRFERFRYGCACVALIGQSAQPE